MSINLDTVVDGQFSLDSEARGGRDADTNDDEINVEIGAISQTRATHRAITQQAIQPYALANINTVTAVQFAEEVAGFRGSNTLQDTVSHFDQCDLQAKLGRNRCCLKPDVTTADDQHLCALNKTRGHCIHIRQITHDKNTVQIATDTRGQAARGRPGAEHQMLIGNRLVVGGDGPRPGVDRVDTGRQAQVDLLIGDASKARTQLGWEPKVDIRSLASMMAKWPPSAS
mgnify:CR=1 FL=1